MHVPVATLGAVAVAAAVASGAPVPVAVSLGLSIVGYKLTSSFLSSSFVREAFIKARLVGVDLNKDTGGPPTYIWLQEQHGAPTISEIDIIYDADPTPEGWVKVEKNLARGTGATTFLVFKRGAADDDSKPAAAGEGGDEEEKGADDSAPAQRPDRKSVV